MTIKLGVPSKGRLMDKDILVVRRARASRCGATGSDREYAAAVDGADGGADAAVGWRDPARTAAGRIHPRRDRVRSCARTYSGVGSDGGRIVAPMGFGHGRSGWFAVPKCWIRTFERSTTSTRSDGRPFGAAGVPAQDRDQVPPPLGAGVPCAARASRNTSWWTVRVPRQGTVAHGYRRGRLPTIQPLRTGETLRANHLKLLEDGLIHRSEGDAFPRTRCKLRAKKRAGARWRTCRADWTVRLSDCVSFGLRWAQIPVCAHLEHCRVI